MEDKLIKDPDSVEGPHSDSTSPALFRNPTLGPTLVPVLIPTLAPNPVSTNELFKEFMKAYLELNKEPRQSPVEYKQTFKSKVPELYYGKLYMHCYHLCQ